MVTAMDRPTGRLRIMIQTSGWTGCWTSLRMCFCSRERRRRCRWLGRRALYLRSLARGGSRFDRALTRRWTPCVDCGTTGRRAASSSPILARRRSGSLKARLLRGEFGDERELAEASRPWATAPRPRKGTLGEIRCAPWCKSVARSPSLRRICRPRSFSSVLNSTTARSIRRLLPKSFCTWFPWNVCVGTLAPLGLASRRTRRSWPAAWSKCLGSTLVVDVA